METASVRNHDENDIDTVMSNAERRKGHRDTCVGRGEAKDVYFVT